MLFARLAALFGFVLGVHAVGGVQPAILGGRGQVEGGFKAQQSFEKHRRHHMANVEREVAKGGLAQRALDRRNYPEGKARLPAATPITLPAGLAAKFGQALIIPLPIHTKAT
ncbi:hypothetical protein T439DRAFT_359627 [Meredithblackwellia eburnea MCA 4105]